MTTIRAKIAQRALAPGERLPSIRKLSATLEVSPSTVVEAYDRLAAEGVIRPRPGSGFYVTGSSTPFALIAAEPNLDRAIDPLWVSRQSLDIGAGAFKPGCGWLSAEWMPLDAIRRAMRSLSRCDSAVLADYGPTHGYPPLRQLLARQFAAEGLAVGADQILLTSSGTQAIDLLCRFLLQPGDTVLLDDPCYFNFQALLRAHRVKVVGVPMSATGPDLDRFVEAVKTRKPRMYITNSAIHNPTGATLSPQVAHQILVAAAEHGVTIVEDDIYADFEPDPSARLALLDGLSRVIRIGSFSKTLSAGLRCGYIVARRDWIEGLLDLLVATSFGGPNPVAAALVATVLQDGSYRKHLGDVRRRLARRRTDVAGQLAGLGIVPWLMPRGGFNLWCKLPGHRDGGAIAMAALRDNVVLAPGNVFSVSQSSPDFMRVNVTQMTDPHCFKVLARVLAEPN
ncbi:aminotransferase-like domain-containing protein [Rhodopseudomonas telluris]|uniref:PLP-dependent aminotransferase family protein n=1 Tax=Rhodopseudomonas telluris TaxID=644215 RepID=A0ABV6EYZ8_9BRAD